MPSAHIELLAGSLRIYDEGEFGSLDPYDWSGSVVRIDRDTIEIVGFSNQRGKVFGRAHWQSVKDAARRIGVKRIKFVRVRDGHELVKWVDVN